MTRAELLSAIDQWDPELCISFLEEDGESAPEYDLETQNGLELLRQDCRERASRLATAA